jgi:hypothetical protein
MTAALLFAATFAAVFTLGIQQINVERRWMLAAAATSPLIGLAHLALFKVLPGPTHWLEIAAYLAGGSAGIVASIWAHPRLVALLRRRSGAVAATAAAASAAAVHHQHAAEQLGETLRLATRIADDSARAVVECWCTSESIGNLKWYDTRSPERALGPEFDESIADALRYLRLRDRVVTHPTQDYLVRFDR